MGRGDAAHPGQQVRLVYESDTALRGPAPRRAWLAAASRIGVALVAWLAAASSAGAATNPILFVTQVPRGDDTANVTASSGSHFGDMVSAGRGGDLWIRYTNGTLKNLTAAAGYGSTDPSGFQDANAIAVRDPAVHWDGAKALFSMVIGAPTQQHQSGTYYWQIYEISGLGAAQSPVITKLANQPANANNITPIYGSDERIIFTSDYPANGAMHLVPQFDEYLGIPTTSGLWSLDPVSGDLKQLNVAPSGDFTPIVDSFGRIVFTQWDHLQRDENADSDSGLGVGSECNRGSYFGTFNYADESPNSAYDLSDRSEIFPEPRICRLDLLAGTPFKGHLFNQFFPWTIQQDGTQSEVLNHLGRHELAQLFRGARTDDPNVVDYSGQYPRFNPRSILGMFQIKEDPTLAGRYFGIDALPKTHTSGQIVSLTAPPSTDADHIAVNYITHRDTFVSIATANNSGHYRDPLPLADGTLIAAHTTTQLTDSGSGPPQTSTYAFRLKNLQVNGSGFYAATTALTPGISKTVSYWDPDSLVTYSGPMWELEPVEVRVRQRPQPTLPALPAPEQQIFDNAGVSLAALQAYLIQNNLALAVSRNVTTRDDLDKQQPFNLHVPGGVQTTGAAGTVYDVSYLEFYQGDYVRGMTAGGVAPIAGRRVLPRLLHDPAAINANPVIPGHAASAALGADGSMAAFVPARRALSWQLEDDNGNAVVTERYWITFQPGEVRVCTSCHGLSSLDQAGHTPPTNPPQALATLLQYWKAQTAATPTATASSPPPTSTPAPATASPTNSPASAPTVTPNSASTATATATGSPPPPTPTATSTPSPAPALCSSGIVMQMPRLQLNSTPFRVHFRGRAVIPKPWVGLDPLVNGVHVVIDSPFGGNSIDLSVPGGARVNGVGWVLNPATTRWLYTDYNAANGVVTRVIVRDRSKAQPGLVSWSIDARSSMTTILPSIQATRATVVLGNASECAAISFGPPGAPRPRCGGVVSRHGCR